MDREITITFTEDELKELLYDFYYDDFDIDDFTEEQVKRIILNQ